MAAAVELRPYDFFPDIEDSDFKMRLDHYITHMKGGYFLRKFDLKTQSCYVSSVVYILIGMFSYLSLDEMTAKIKKVLNFGNFQTPLLKNIVGGNAADITSIRISSFSQLDDVFENGIAFLGLVTMGGEGRYVHGTIQHYFLVKKHKDGTYSILSSYGSSDVAMRQFQTELVTSELDVFAEDLAEPAKSDVAKTRIRDFMEKYFLNKAFGTIQRKTLSDMKDTYGDEEVFRPDDLRWRKNEDADIAREIAYYQKEPIYVMLFPNMLGAFNTELAALELIDASTAYERSGVGYDAYVKKYEEWNEKNEQLLKNLEDVRAKIAAEPELSLTPLAKIEAEIESFTPMKPGLEASLQGLTLSPQKDASGLLPLSPSAELLSQAPPPEPETGPELTPEEIDELGIGPVKLDDRFAKSTEGGRKTKRAKNTKRVKKMKKTKKVKRKSRKI